MPLLTHIRNQIRFCSIVPLPLLYAVLKVIDFPRYSSKGNGENKILRGIFRVVSLFPLHFVLYLEIWITFWTVYVLYQSSTNFCFLKH